MGTSSRKSKTGEQHISRTPLNSRPGFRVRLYLHGVYVVSKHFADVKFGGEEKALAAAIKFRNKKMAEMKMEQGVDRSTVIHGKEKRRGVIETQRAGKAMDLMNKAMR